MKAKTKSSKKAAPAAGKKESPALDRQALGYWRGRWSVFYYGTGEQLRAAGLVKQPLPGEPGCPNSTSIRWTEHGLRFNAEKRSRITFRIRVSGWPERDPGYQRLREAMQSEFRRVDSDGKLRKTAMREVLKLYSGDGSSSPIVRLQGPTPDAIPPQPQPEDESKKAFEFVRGIIDALTHEELRMWLAIGRNFTKTKRPPEDPTH